MPGRHGGGPMGGGFRGGGMGGMPGGGFRGPGWGWGGGWRPRGPWGGGYYRRPFWGGFRGWFPWIPLWGPGYGWGGYGGGFGCGGIGCIVILIIFACLIISGIGSALGGGGFRGSSYYGSANPNYNNNSSNNSADVPNLANESSAIQTQTAVDLTELHQAFDSRIPTWQNQLSANQEKSIPAADAGLTQDNNTKAVIYGKCGTAFYVYVVENTKPDNVPANAEGYAYTTASSPGACHPVEYTVYQSEDVGGGWYFVWLQSTQ